MVLGLMGIVYGKNIDFVIGKEAHDAYHAGLWGDKAIDKNITSHQPHGNFYAPVFTSKDRLNADIGGLVGGTFAVDAMLVDILPEGVRGIHMVIENSCNNSYTYALDGNEASRTNSPTTQWKRTFLVNHFSLYVFLLFFIDSPTAGNSLGTR